MNAQRQPVPLSRSPFLVLLLWSLCPLLPGCSGGPRAVGPNTVAEIHTITTELGGKVDAVAANQNALIARQKELEARTTAQMQLAADQVDGASYVNARNLDNPHTRLTGEKLKTAADLLGPPTPDNARRVEEELAFALSASQQDQDKLRRLLEAERKEAKVIADARDAARLNSGKAAEQLSAVTATLQDTSKKLAAAEAQARLEAARAKDAQEARDAERAARTRQNIAYGFMGFGGLLIVAAIVATFLRVPGVLIGGLAGGGALLALGWMITVLEDLLQNTWFKVALGVVVLGALGVVVYLGLQALKTRRKASMDAAIGQGAIGAIQEAKNDDAKLGGAVYASLKPYLKEWFVDDDGKPDIAIEKEIDRRLQALNLKNPQGAEASIVNALRGGVAEVQPVRERRVREAPLPVAPGAGAWTGDFRNAVGPGPVAARGSAIR
ncbi:MAG: hypothetical protein IPL39_07195 [Opitutaceae bacterium]|nr:hypothetical protein [Opitutaceae bacterium]